MSEYPPGVTISEATGTASGSERSSLPSLSLLLERVMEEEILHCIAEGITDPDVIRERKLAARDAIKAAYLDRLNQISAELSQEQGDADA
jgi:hypothetical protein